MGLNPKHAQLNWKSDIFGQVTDNIFPEWLVLGPLDKENEDSGFKSDDPVVYERYQKITTTVFSHCQVEISN